MKKHIIIINGPNLNLLGKRNVEVYGSVSFDDYFNNDLKPLADENEFELIQVQSNSEGELVNYIHQYGFQDNTSIILNAGAYTHYSYAIRDAVESVSNNITEVHISNIYNRESFRQKSVLHSVVNGVIFGFGLKSYKVAMLNILFE